MIWSEVFSPRSLTNYSVDLAEPYRYAGWLAGWLATPLSSAMACLANWLVYDCSCYRMGIETELADDDVYQQGWTNKRVNRPSHQPLPSLSPPAKVGLIDFESSSGTFNYIFTNAISLSYIMMLIDGYRVLPVPSGQMAHFIGTAHSIQLCFKIGMLNSRKEDKY